MGNPTETLKLETRRREPRSKEVEEVVLRQFVRLEVHRTVAPSGKYDWSHTQIIDNGWATLEKRIPLPQGTHPCEVKTIRYRTSRHLQFRGGSDFDAELRRFVYTNGDDPVVLNDRAKYTAHIGELVGEGWTLVSED